MRGRSEVELSRAEPLGFFMNEAWYANKHEGEREGERDRGREGEREKCRNAPKPRAHHVGL